MSIVIPFASSKLGKDIIQILLKKGIDGKEIVGLVREESRLEEFKSSGVIIRKVDFNNYDSIYDGLKGGKKLVFISSGDVVNRPIQHKDIIKAAQKLNYQYLVYTSLVRKTEDGSSPIFYFEECHIETEKDIRKAGIPYTILVNGCYTDVIVEHFINETIFEKGFFLPAGINSSHINYATRYDMAEGTVNLLLSDKLSSHYGKEYYFTTDTKTSYEDIANIFSEITGSQIKYSSPDIATFKSELKKLGFSDELIDFKVSLALSYQAGELSTDHKSDLQQFLDNKRNPTTVKEFLTDYFINNLKDEYNKL